MDATKVYRADIELGITTDTYDIEGSVIRRQDASSVTREDIESALDSFRGRYSRNPRCTVL
jgi:tRNA pseudouridine55 synthase